MDLIRLVALTPMIQTNIENNIWEIDDIYLKEGDVKFR